VCFIKKKRPRGRSLNVKHSRAHGKGVKRVYYSHGRGKKNGCFNIDQGEPNGRKGRRNITAKEALETLRRLGYSEKTPIFLKKEKHVDLKKRGGQPRAGRRSYLKNRSKNLKQWRAVYRRPCKARGKIKNRWQRKKKNLVQAGTQAVTRKNSEKKDPNYTEKNKKHLALAAEPRSTSRPLGRKERSDAPISRKRGEKGGARGTPQR